MNKLSYKPMFKVSMELSHTKLLVMEADVRILTNTSELVDTASVRIISTSKFIPLRNSLGNTAMYLTNKATIENEIRKSTCCK